MMSNAISQNVVHLPPPGEDDSHLNSTIFARAALLGIEDLHFKSDSVTGLKAIVAIHNTSRGPALGGTRCLNYDSEHDAIDDVIRLARSMSYKSAFADLPYGGGKAVLMHPQQLQNPDAYFESYGEFVNTFHGRFITAVDVGTSVEDMDKIARKTSHVLSTSSSRGDPSHDTARGVLRGIQAAVKAHLKHDDLEGITVAIQGVGKVGSYLAQLLHEQGAELIISDMNQQAAQDCAGCFDAVIVPVDKIMSISCDVLAPCALGASINSRTVHLIKAKIVCGAANNQLATDHIGDKLYQKQILFVPDYVVNAGGLIHVVLASHAEAQTKVSEIYDAVIDLYQRSEKNNEPSHRVANRIAEQILYRSKKHVAHL